MHADLLRHRAFGAAELGALWRQLAEDPASPDHFELSEHGELISSPKPTNRHQVVNAWVASELRARLGGLVLSELSVLTSAGVRVPDVAWLPIERRNEPLTQTPMLRSPPLVVEVLSPGNRRIEIDHKVAAYLDAGSQEVIVVGLTGSVVYHRADGEHAESALGATLMPPDDLFA